jgi:hypothetical protein
MDDRVDFTTGNLIVALVNPNRVAVILVFPTATPVASPTEEIVATVVSELNQVT